jgi:peptidoglycan/LPS O-acetylase OafA/YrhL
MAARTHIAGLDGLRGLALAVIMGYHLAPSAVPGGFITLTLFFSLSGFLITTLVLDDIDSGRFALGDFYARRVRRLLPAGLLVLAGVAAVWAMAGWMDTTVRADIAAAAAQVFNWREIATGQVYGTESVSPVMHYWSLAVEEQVYLVLPVLLLAGRRRPGLVLATALSAPIVSSVIWSGERTVLYYGTHVRAGEVILGAIAAVIVRRGWRLGHRMATVVGTSSLGAVLLVAFTVSVDDPALYRGGLLAGGALTAFTVATVPMGAAARFIDNPVLVRIGRLSYVVYLVHWPTMVGLRRLEWNSWAVAVGTVAVSWVIAEVVHRTYEVPMRSVWNRRRFVAVVSAVVVAGSVSTLRASPAPVTFESAAEELERRSELLAATGAGPTLGIFGDSKMLSLGMGMGPVDGFDLVYMHAILGCPLGRGGEVMVDQVPLPVPSECDWETIPSRDLETDIEVAVVWYGTWDARGRRLEPLGDEWLDIGDADYRRWLRGEYEEYLDLLRSRVGAELILLMNLHPNGVTENEEMNRFLADLAESHDDVEILDFAGWVTGQDVGFYLPDGVHLSWGQPTEYSPSKANSALRVMRTWLAPRLCVEVIDRFGPDRAGEACEGIVRERPLAGS